MNILTNAGTPDLQLAGFSLWLHGRQFEAAQDFWDGNWLRATAHCGAAGTEVTLSGSFIRISELVAWASECRDLLEGTRRSAELPTLEPELAINLEMDHLGHVEMVVEITPDHLKQSHRFKFEIDQSYLPGLIKSIERIQERFPVRGAPTEAT